MAENYRRQAKVLMITIDKDEGSKTIIATNLTTYLAASPGKKEGLFKKVAHWFS